METETRAKNAKKVNRINTEAQEEYEIQTYADNILLVDADGNPITNNTVQSHINNHYTETQVTLGDSNANLVITGGSKAELKSNNDIQIKKGTDGNKEININNDKTEIVNNKEINLSLKKGENGLRLLTKEQNEKVVESNYLLETGDFHSGVATIAKAVFTEGIIGFDHHDIILKQDLHVPNLSSTPIQSFLGGAHSEFKGPAKEGEETYTVYNYNDPAKLFDISFKSCVKFGNGFFQGSLIIKPRFRDINIYTTDDKPTPFTTNDNHRLGIMTRFLIDEATKQPIPIGTIEEKYRPRVDYYGTEIFSKRWGEDDVDYFVVKYQINTEGGIIIHSCTAVTKVKGTDRVNFIPCESTDDPSIYIPLNYFTS